MILLADGSGSMRRWVVAVTAAAMLATTTAAASAPEEGASEESFGVYYGDGLRHLAEQDHDRAVRALFRAYGLEPSAQIMGLIVEAYDRMGRCSAASRQLDFFRRHHGDEEAPQLRACSTTGRVEVDCAGHEEGLVVDDGFEVGCSESVELPADQSRRLSWKATGADVEIDLEPDEHREIVYEAEDREAEVSRITSARGEISKLPFELDEGPEVPRLTLPSDFDPRRYRVFETADGLYEVWRLAEGAERRDDGAEVEIVCPDDAPEGESDEDCLWLREQMESQ